jgi:hypothetical protein
MNSSQISSLRKSLKRAEVKAQLEANKEFGGIELGYGYWIRVGVYSAPPGVSWASAGQLRVLLDSIAHPVYRVYHSMDELDRMITEFSTQFE